MYKFTTQKQVRDEFWIGLEQFKRRGYRQNDYDATIRSEWIEFVDMLVRNDHISESLAEKVTL